MMLPAKSHLQLSRMVLKVHASGVRCFKQELNAAIINHVYANQQILKDLAISHE